MFFQGKHFVRYALALVALALSFYFVACGDGDSSTGDNFREKDAVVDQFSDLPDCDKDNEGEKFLVEEDSSVYICMDKKWYALKSTDDDSDSTETDKDTLSRDTSAKDTVSQDTLAKDTVDHDTADTDSIKQEVDVKDTAVLDSEQVPISLDSLVGFSQKGPFTTGSTVYLYELDNGRTLKQTNGNFISNIINDNGRYHFSARDLVSQYAMIVVDGNYRNEVTGEVSDNTIRLKAITDLTKRRSANVNLLSHLEFDRVYYLVTREKKTVKKAKLQAQREVLDQFYIKSDNFKSSEDMDVFGDTDADAALLAVSILLQGDRTEAALTALLSMISTSLSDKGTWDNDSIKTSIADWIFRKDSLGLIPQFRTNVANWKLSKTVPDFEKYVRNYWYSNYGIGNCSKNGKVLKNDNGKSKYADLYFICKEGAWQTATDIEKDTYLWPDTVDGTKRAGDVNKDSIYVFDKDHWRHADEIEAVLGGCTEGHSNEVGKANDTYYTCHTVWTVSTDIEKDTYLWPDSADGATRHGDVNEDSVYVYDKDHWRHADAVESVIGGCTVGGKVDRVGDTYYICRDRAWTPATDIEKDTYLWPDSADGAVRRGDVNKDSVYVFDKDHWRHADAVESVLGGCVETRAGVVSAIGSNYYICQSSRTWRVATDIEKDTCGWGANYTAGTVKSGNVNKNYYYVFEGGKWRLGDSMDYLMQQAGGTGCVNEGARSAVRYTDNYYYICKKPAKGNLPHVWVKTEQMYSDTADFQSQCNSSGPYSKGQIFKGYVSKTEYVCDNNSFRTLQNNESRNRQGCVSYIDQQYFKVDSINGYKSYYKCDNGNKKWVFAIDRNKGSIKDSRDKNRTYGTITIGKQKWLSEDLRYGTRVDANLDMTYYSYRNSSIYIRAVLDTVCPSGWHVPSRDEWNTLLDYAGASNLLSGTGEYGWSGSPDTYGFSAYKNGIYASGVFEYGYGETDRANYWLRGEEYIVSLSQGARDDYWPSTIRAYTAVRCVQ